MGFLDGLQSKIENKNDKNDKNQFKPKMNFESEIDATSVLSEN